MIIYGKSGVTFAKDLYYDPSGKEKGKTDDWEKAKKMGFDIVEHFLGTFNGLGAWLENTRKFAYKHGYVETMFGRRRRLPNLHSVSPALKADAERQAVNAPIQGTGSDLTMLSVIHLNNWLKENKFKSLLVATVHDSIVLDVYVPELHVVGPKVKEIMEHVHEPYIDTQVPIISELEVGTNYGSVTEISIEECEKLVTLSDFSGWTYEAALNKYRAEIKTLKKMGWGYQEVIDYLVKWKRPLKELAQTIIDVYKK